MPDLPNNVIVIFIEGGVVQWIDAAPGDKRWVVIDYDKHSDEKFWIHDEQPVRTSLDRWDQDIREALQPHLDSEPDPWTAKKLWEQK